VAAIRADGKAERTEQTWDRWSVGSLDWKYARSHDEVSEHGRAGASRATMRGITRENKDSFENLRSAIAMEAAFGRLAGEHMSVHHGISLSLPPPY
jgi:hypothetical protein